MTNAQIKNHLIKSGVRKLKESGYQNADSENILTDIVYIDFFASMLKDNKGNGGQVDNVIDDLLDSIDSLN